MAILEAKCLGCIDILPFWMLLSDNFWMHFYAYLRQYWTFKPRFKLLSYQSWNSYLFLCVKERVQKWRFCQIMMWVQLIFINSLWNSLIKYGSCITIMCSLYVLIKYCYHLFSRGFSLPIGYVVHKWS